MPHQPGPHLLLFGALTVNDHGINSKISRKETIKTLKKICLVTGSCDPDVTGPLVVLVVWGVMEGGGVLLWPYHTYPIQEYSEIKAPHLFFFPQQSLKTNIPVLLAQRDRDGHSLGAGPAYACIGNSSYAVKAHVISVMITVIGSLV